MANVGLAIADRLHPGLRIRAFEEDRRSSRGMVPSRQEPRASIRARGNAVRRLIGVAVALMLAAGCGDVPGGEPATIETETTTATPAPASTPTTGTTTVVEPVVTALGPAPWVGAPLPTEAVPNLVVARWTAATNRAWCSMLFPEAPVGLAPDATLRSADFGGGWGLAWDLPDGPGRSPSGEYCADCGRGAFGVAGVGLAAAGVDLGIWDERLTWDDGSEAGYGPEGTAADALPGAPHLASVVVSGQGCLYNVWSFLGEGHLRSLIDQLRFVEDLQAEPLEPQPVAVVEHGPAPWEGEPLTADRVPQTLLDEWTLEAGAPDSCPLLVPEDLGEGAAGARIRHAASEGEMLAAWDLPSGPGRYGTGDYCADCGRGAFGIGTFQDAGTSPLAVTDRWDDGSEGTLGSEATRLSGGIPADRFAFTDPESGEPAAAPSEMFLHPAGFECRYRVWSFLGPEHVEYLVGHLRRVEGHPG
jgi:hypothetical protein